MLPVQAFAVHPSSSCRPRAAHRSLLTVAKSTRKKKADTSLTGGTRGEESTTASTVKQHHLVIVESPSKCATISKILNQFAEEEGGQTLYTVLSCRGHIRDLSRKAVTTEAATSDDASPSVEPTFPYAIPGVDLEHRFAPVYEVLPEKADVIRELQAAAKTSDLVLLATDADREGEAMAWHLTQVLGPTQHSYRRISFVELTPSAVLTAVKQPYDINPHLVAAQETRRVLDRLTGFTLSPLLWKKISPGLSAGRVQSVGMALVVNRERERLLFPSSRYWKLKATFEDPSNALNHLTFTLQSLNETTPVVTKSADFTVQRLDASTARAVTAKHHVASESDADRLLQQFQETDTSWTVVSVESRRHSKTAPPSYRTSSLQQDAFQSMGWSVSQTMRVAQQLYEEGHITYMRTDSTSLSQDAVKALKRQLGDKYSDNTTPTVKKRKSNTKSRFAQEAHEAVRPALVDGSFPSPTNSASVDAGARLYRLIYQRTLASSMPPRIVNRTRVVVQGKNQFGSAEFVASGEVVLDPGYSEIYPSRSVASSASDGESSDEIEDSEANASSAVLPPLHEGQVLRLEALRATEHFTLPPPRFTEASFVKQLETLGVGRPSTFAKIISILTERAYVFSRSRSGTTSMTSGGGIAARRASGQSDFLTTPIRQSLVPTLPAFAVTSLLETHCPSYVDSEFTAEMEDKLDRIAQSDSSEGHGDAAVDSEAERYQYLHDYYAGPNGLASRVKRLEDDIQGDEARQVSLPALQGEETNEVGLFVGPWGPYVSQLGSPTLTSNRPTTAALPQNMASDLSLITLQALQSVLRAKRAGGRVLGQHPRDGRNIWLKLGRYGAYLQWGDDGDKESSTHSLPRDVAAAVPDSMSTTADGESSDTLVKGLSLDEVVGYVSLPRTVCLLDNSPIIASIGPFGPYLKYRNSYISLNETDGDVWSIDPVAAEQVVRTGSQKKTNARGLVAELGRARGVVAELGEIDGGSVTVKSGRFGKYISWKNVTTKFPTEYAQHPEKLPLDEAWSLIQEKIGVGQSKEATKKTRKSETTNDTQLPPAPKRPLSAYLHFCAAKRPGVSSSKSSLGSVSKVLSLLWSEASSTEREKYHDMAEKDKEAYHVALENWKMECELLLKHQMNGDSINTSVSGTGERRGGTNSRTKPLKSIEGKKHATSAYTLFCREMRPLLVGDDGTKPSIGEASKMLAKQWRECGDETRHRFLQQVRIEAETLP